MAFSSLLPALWIAHLSISGRMLLTLVIAIFYIFGNSLCKYTNFYSESYYIRFCLRLSLTKLPSRQPLLSTKPTPVLATYISHKESIFPFLKYD